MEDGIWGTLFNMARGGEGGGGEGRGGGLGNRFIKGEEVVKKSCGSNRLLHIKIDISEII